MNTVRRHSIPGLLLLYLCFLSHPPDVQGQSEERPPLSPALEPSSFLPLTTAAPDLLRATGVPTSPHSTSPPPAPLARHAAMVKFRDNAPIDNMDDALRVISAGLDPSHSDPVARIKPLVAPDSEEGLDTLQLRAVQMDPTYRRVDFSKYYTIYFKRPVDLKAFTRALRALPVVEEAFVPAAHSPPGPGCGIPPLDADGSVTENCHLSKQPEPGSGALPPSSGGISAECAWAADGGQGEGRSIAVIEFGWPETPHQEWANAWGAGQISVVPDSPEPQLVHAYHGSSTLGVLVARHGGGDPAGIVPDARVLLTSLEPLVLEPTTATDLQHDVFNAVRICLGRLVYGDVLLIEVEALPLGTGLQQYRPVEVDSHVAKVIRLATALGVTVVEPSGNGEWTDLDEVTLSGDSGAIVVASSCPPGRTLACAKTGDGVVINSLTTQHQLSPYSAYGDRIDCYAWGSLVCTTDEQPGEYRSYGGTSAASAIIAGAAVAVQSIAARSLSACLPPPVLRKIFRDDTLGTRMAASEALILDGDFNSTEPVSAHKTGVMPDLCRVIDHVLEGARPDAYLRDHKNDTGDPHNLALSTSPDIIVRQAEATDPQASFGHGSGTEQVMDLGHTIVAGQDNYIYLRAMNRGGTVANGVTASVYYAKPDTLLTPDDWNVIKENFLAFPTIENEASNDVELGLTVSEALTWPAEDLPPEGHYCFVGILSHPEDPAPPKFDWEEEDWSWDEYRTVIRNNNNITWRNFNVVELVANTPGRAALRFQASGTPKKGHRMHLQFHCPLPPGSRAWLTLPAEANGILRPLTGRPNREGRLLRYPLNSRGVTRTVPIEFPARSKWSLALQVEIPQEHLTRPYFVWASQFYRGEEVGRVTWKLVPPASP